MPEPVMEINLDGMVMKADWGFIGTCVMLGIAGKPCGTMQFNDDSIPDLPPGTRLRIKVTVLPDEVG